MKAKTVKSMAKNMATIALDGGAKLEREYTIILPMFDPLYGPAVVFVSEEKKEEVVICRVYADNNRFVTDESITPAELEELKVKSREYLEEIMEDDKTLSDQDQEEVFIGKLVKDFPEQTVERKELDIMFV